MRGVSTAVAVVSGTVMIVLAGCGAGDVLQNELESAVEGQVEDALEGVGDVDLELGGGQLPSGFPTDFPLPDGRLTVGVGTPDGWLLTYFVADRTVLEAYVGQLQSAGFTLDLEHDLGAGETQAWQFSGDEYLAQVSIVQIGSTELTAQVLVTNNPAE